MTATRRIRADVARATESLYGPTRAARPSDLRGSAVICPFCPGNEALTGPVLTADPGSRWQTRVVANRYPAVVEPDGRHEVIVDSRAHDLRWATQDRAALATILEVYRAREAAGYDDAYAYVTVFKNSGDRAGASLHHPHSQVVALRAVPRSVLARLALLEPDCRVCRIAHGEDARIVARTARTIAYVPDGARTDFEVRIAPLAHAGRFSATESAVATDVAQAMADVMKRLGATLGEAFPFNIVVQSAPCEPRADRLHWEIEIVPRLESFGGFELGTGGFLLGRLPEDAAAILRAAVPDVTSHA
jgi:UDPglucose--hexose-1-phosphate uridylyltransferase